jgi:hypothetical protein
MTDKQINVPNIDKLWARLKNDTTHNDNLISIIKWTLKCKK